MVFQPDDGLLEELNETERRNVQQLTDVIPYWHKHDIPYILSNYDDNVVWLNVPAEEVFEGTASFRRYMEELFTGFPDVEFDVTHRIAHGDYVAERWFVRGTHRGTFSGIPATGRRVNLAGMTLVQFKDGKFVRGEFYYDSMMMMRQLGLMPPLSVAQSRPGELLLWLAVKGTRIARIVTTPIRAAVSALRRRR